MNRGSSHGRRRTVIAALVSAAALLLAVSSPRSQAREASRSGAGTGTSTALAAKVIVPFDTERWHLDEGSAFVPFEGRTALAGTAYMKGVSFLNGVVEADIWLTGAANFAGLLFRTQSFDESEWFWLRTAKTNGLIADAIQYAPSFHRVFCWQLRPDAIGPANVAKNQWVHMKVEILDDSATFYAGDMARPALKVEHLGLGARPGSAGLKILSTGSVYFSNFSYRADESARVVSKPTAMAPNILADWEMSPSYPMANVADVPTAYPAGQMAEVKAWTRPDVEVSGLVNITRYHGTKHHGRAVLADGRPNYAILKTSIDADRARRVRMNFGYSDAATVFLNGNPLFSGNSAFISRNLAYGGWINYNDAVFLDLKEGRNELVAVVAEDFGGWGWQAKLDDVRGLTVTRGRR
jgi:hypothetical protein